MKKRCLSILLSFVLLFGLLPVPAAAAAWEGAGTEADPYLITTKEQLIASMTDSSKYYALGTDLTFTSEDFAEGGICYGKACMIGEREGYWPRAQGHLDGKGHTIYNLEIPLIQSNETGGSVSNLNLSGGKLSGGALIASNYGTVSNCEMTGTWTVEVDPGSGIGALVSGNEGTITGCRNTATVQLVFQDLPEGIPHNYTDFGGICSTNKNKGVISGCGYNGKIKCINNTTLQDETPWLTVSGIAGENYGQIQLCGSQADISASEISDVELRGAFGIVRENHGTISTCTNSGNLTFINENSNTSYPFANAAGIACYNAGLVENCYNTGKVAYAGIVMRNGFNAQGGTVTNCTNSGEIVGYHAGGIVCKTDSEFLASEIISCRNTGYIHADEKYNSAAGGIIAQAGRGGVIRDCMNLGQVSGSLAGGIVGNFSNLGSVQDGVTADNLLITLEQCCNVGVVSGVKDIRCQVGGLAGAVHSSYGPIKIKDSYTVGEIRTDGCSAESYAGGLLGSGYSVSNTTEAYTVTINNCYATGKITGDAKYIGSVTGWFSAPLQDGEEPVALVTGCYALNRGIPAIGTDNSESQASTTLLSAEEMGVQDSFAGFDFDTAWSMSDTLKRPYLTALGEDEIDNWQDGSTPVEPDVVAITGLSPQDGATDVGYSAENPPKFYIVFNEKIEIDSANWPQFDFTKEPFRIYRTSDDQLIYTAQENNFLPGTCADASVTNSQTQLVITPTNAHILLDPITDYYITMGEGFVKLEDGSTSPAIEKGDWAFRTDGTNKTGTFSFAGSNGKDITTDFTYSDDYFSGSARDYDQDLALMSLQLAMSAFNRSNVSYRKEIIGKNVYDLLTQLEFQDINIDAYEGKPTRTSVGYAIAHKRILVNEQEYTLIALALRGANYETEWADNVCVLSDTEHQGFAVPAEKVKEGLLSYIAEYAAGEKIKLWITGYSRAAAISNQLAGTLDRALYEGTDILDLGATLDMADFYVYTFETPRPTALSAAKTTKWDNIHNIVNPIDLVPKVAPATWGYYRYGITYYLPSYESKYSEEFTDNILKVAERTLELCGTNLTKVVYKEQGAMLDDVFSHIPGKPTDDAWILAQGIAAGVLEKHFDTSGVLNETTLLDQAKLIGDLKSDLENAFEMQFGASYVKSILLKELCWKPLGETGKTLLEYGVSAHVPELTLAWMELLSDETSNMELLSDEKSDADPYYRQLHVNCPVDIKVFDSKGKLVAQFIDDVPQEIEDSTIVAYLDNDGQKTVILPLEETFTIQITATGEGQMTYSVKEFNFGCGKSERVVNFYDVALTTGDQFEGTVPKDLEDGERVTYTLSKNSEPISPSEDIADESDQNAVTCYITTEVEGNGEVSGSGARTKGEYAKLTAVPDEGWKFEGWYLGQQLLSGDREYRFRVETDMVLTAKFAAESAPIAPAITTTVLPNGTVGTAYSQTLASTGTAPITWSIASGVLPDGLTLVNDTIKGTPSKAGDFRFTVKATNAGGSDTKEFTVKIADMDASKYHSVTLSGAGTNATGAGSHAEGTTVNIYAGTKSGYTFTGWTSNDVTITKASSKNASFVMPDKNVTVTANWTYTGGGSTGGSYTYCTIKATAGVNGAISPSGSVSVRSGKDQTFTITPDTGYAISDVKIDGKSVGAVKSYTFENVKGNHTIEAIFMKANGNPQTGVFVDVPEGSYYEEAVAWAVENGITKGTSDTTFDPNGICTRAQAVTFLWRAAGSPAPKTSTMPFTDVKAGSYYYDAVLWAVENGITKGTSDTTFSPDATCSRAQIVTFLWRSQEAPAAGAVNPFTDVKADAYYAEAVLWAVKEDVTKGTTDTTFSPNADCTRAQIVTFIWRALAE